MASGRSGRLKSAWPLWRCILVLLNIIALILSIIMTWHYLAGGQIAGCGGGSPCEQVLSSRWSSIAGIVPVSGLAVGVWLAMLVAILFSGPSSDINEKRLAWNVMLILSGSVAGSAIWFTFVQKWLIGSFCPYCMTAHITSLTFSVLVLREALKSREDIKISSLQVFVRAFAGLILAGLLAVSQAGFRSASKNVGESESASIPVDYTNSPIIGSPDAPYIVRVLFDYQCPHCQKLHFLLSDAVARYNGKLAFVLFPAPLNTKCNPFVPAETDEFRNSCELTRTGLAVWAGKREAFNEFEAWMFSFETGDSWTPRSPEDARNKAVELLGEAVFENAVADPWIEQYLRTSVQLYGQTIQDGKGGIPKLIFGSKWVIPESYNVNDLLSLLQKSLGVPKP